MQSRILYISCLYCLLSFSTAVFAQKKTVPKQITTSQKIADNKKGKADSLATRNRLKIISSTAEQSVKLRWALENAKGWKACNTYGFRVERYTVVKDTTWLAVPELNVLADPYKARPLEEWETLAKKDDYAAILAQTLYGKSMQVDMTDNNPLTQIVNESQDLQQRYTLSLLACDMSFEAAKLAAWGYEDKTVKKNERYFYRIIPLVPKEQLVLDSAFVLVDMKSYKPLPAVGKPEVIFGDSTATLGYNYFFLKDQYTAFHIERSEDGGKTFHQLTKTPLTGLNEKKGQESYQFYYTDKLKDNNTEYQYRIKGLTAFSETGPISQVVKGKGIARVTAFPHLISSVLNEQGYAELEWEFDQVNESKIKGFELNHSTRNEGPYKVIQTSIAPNLRKLTVKKLENSNYFSLTAVGKNGERKTSPVRFLQLIDSIPPAAPEIITATVDSLGKVHVEWKANAESDLLGYKLFRSNNLKEEAYPLNDTVIRTTVWNDQLDPSMINRKIYYSVMAFDKHYNQSLLSEAKAVERPDVTPPTSPVFKNYTITDKGVYLQWARCEDEDVAKHVLLRKEITPNATWLTVAQFRDTTSYYTDQTAEGGKSYYYTILAKDKAGLESPPLPSLKLNLPADPAKLKVTLFKAVPNTEGSQVELQWQTERSDINRFEVYKGEEKAPVTLWKVVSGKQRSIKDNIKIGYPYKYMIRIVLKDGSTGTFSTLSF